jgi:hypothetical protein
LSAGPVTAASPRHTASRSSIEAEPRQAGADASQSDSAAGTSRRYVIASDSEAIQAKQPPQSSSLDCFALLAMTTEMF